MKKTLVFSVILAGLIVLSGFGCTPDKRAKSLGILLQPFQATPSSTSWEYTPPAPDDVVSLQFFGDTMLDRNVAKAMNQDGLAYIFENKGSLFGSADLLGANLEGPFADKRMYTTKEIAFRFDPKFAADLKSFGFTAFNLANNHAYDMGRKNAAYTRTVLAAAGLGYFGDELNEGPEYTWVTTTKANERIAFLGIHNTYHQPNLKKVEAALIDARSKADIVIVNVHWGEEYHPLSNKKQQTLGHWFIDHGADAVIGHHPHVVEEAEVYKGKPIFYSLGNFVFDQYFSTTTQQGLSVVLTVQKNKVLSAELKPLVSIHSQVEPMAGEALHDFMTWFVTSSRLSGKKIDNGVIKL